MFQGETAITVDDKGRMAVPTAHRDLVARVSNNRLVLTYNPFESGCLWLYAESEWERVRDDVMSKPNTQRVVRLLQQKLVGSAAHLELDGNGRISIPASHRGAVGIEKIAERQVAAAGNMARRKAGARLGIAELDAVADAAGGGR